MTDYQERENRISQWWRLSEEYSLHEAALLIVGVDPHCETGSKCKDWKPHEQPDGYGAVVRAITGALGTKVSGRHIPHYDTDINGNICGEFEGTTDIHCSTVGRDSLVAWLKSNSIKGGFFFPDSATTDTPDYLDPKNPRHRKELAAAVLAWQAMGDENLLRGKTPKQALTSWVESRYKELGLFHEKDEPKNKTKKGDVNKSAIERVVAFANWKDGGPPKTPSA